jgi:hypothetical protein
MYETSAPTVVLRYSIKRTILFGIRTPSFAAEAGLKRPAAIGALRAIANARWQEVGGEGGVDKIKLKVQFRIL